MDDSRSVERLTDGERDVLRMVVHGMTYAEICDDLAIGAQTVYNRFGSAAHKLGAKNRSHAVAMAVEHGWFDPGGDGPEGAQVPVRPGGPRSGPSSSSAVGAVDPRRP